MTAPTDSPLMANWSSVPMVCMPSAGALSPTSHRSRDPQMNRAGGGIDTRTGHTTRDTGVADPHTGPAEHSQRPSEPQAMGAVLAGPAERLPTATSSWSEPTGESSRLADTHHETHERRPAIAMLLADPTLALLADVLDDLENTRIANENRLRQLTRTETDTDGHERGFALPTDHPDVARLTGLVDGITKLEHDATLNLNRVMRQHPLGPWIKQLRGVGEKQAARLLAVIGDPYIRPQRVFEDGTIEPARPRLVSELWQYCGHGDPARSKRRKGKLVEFSPVAKSRLYLIAESCKRQLVKPCRPGDHVDDCACSVYRLVYDDRRAVTKGRSHATDCVRCGPSGRPAPAGSPWSDGHAMADALRIVGKEFLRDLWIEAQRIHHETGGDPGHKLTEPQAVGAAVASIQLPEEAAA